MDDRSDPKVFGKGQAIKDAKKQVLFRTGVIG